MLPPSFLLLLGALALPAWSSPSPRTLEFLDVCEEIKDAISNASDVYYPGHFLYAKDVYHWASSSSETSACSVEPGTAEDVAIILGILGDTRTPFAVKGGGHASNPGFSSTEGVQIAMYRFSEVTYDASTQTATIGTGLVWDDVYAQLVPQGVNVIGGRVTGVGVAGFTLGGGYSWKSNQYGLTVDTVVSFELVKPTGEIVTVTDDSDSELFFGLKGGFNNFGIVTRFTLRTFPQTDVWGGLITYTFNNIDEASEATTKFSTTVTDPKAAIITTYNFLLGQPGISQLLFYDGPTPPPGIFDDFLAIPHFTKDVGTRDYLSLVKASPANATANTRAIFNTVPMVQYTPTILDAIKNETIFWGTKLSLLGSTFVSYDVEPFLPSTWLAPGAAEAAYPPTSSRSQALLPLNIYFAWAPSLLDENFQNAVRASSEHLRSVAIAEGQQGLVEAPLYPNYAIYDTPLEKLYGENVQRLRDLKALVDPEDVMGLAGGFKF